jgi:hypothetical protein
MSVWTWNSDPWLWNGQGWSWGEATFDPADLTLSQVGDDVLLEWPPATIPDVTHYAIFRRTGTVMDPFDPEVDAEHDRVAVSEEEYLDVAPGAGDFAYQVFPVQVT